MQNCARCTKLITGDGTQPLLCDSCEGISRPTVVQIKFTVSELGQLVPHLDAIVNRYERSDRMMPSELRWVLERLFRARQFPEFYPVTEDK